jgi:hypothetical protein
LNVTIEDIHDIRVITTAGYFDDEGETELVRALKERIDSFGKRFVLDFRGTRSSLIGLELTQLRAAVSAIAEAGGQIHFCNAGLLFRLNFGGMEQWFFADRDSAIAAFEETKQSGPTREELVLTLRSFNAELIAYLSNHPHLLYQISPRSFEQLIADVLADMGYEVQLTPESRDGGRDILAAFALPASQALTIVECKRYAAGRPVGIDLVRQFLWVVDQKDRASSGLIATTSYFSPEARETERQYQYRLKLQDFEGIKEWLGRFGTWRKGKDSGLWTPPGEE